MAAPPLFFEKDFPWRSRPAEYYRGKGWEQDGFRRRGVKKPYYHFIWPKDGKNGSKWGRMKDILTGKGPDIHVTVSADKEDYMHHRQRRPRWARHADLEDRGPDCSLRYDLPWVRPFRRYAGKRYDFRTRQYRRPDTHMWSDAIWEGRQGTRDHIYGLPHAIRDMNGEWWERGPHHAPMFFEDHPPFML